MKTFITCCIMLAFLAPASLQAQTTQIFIKITDDLVIQGESTAPGHLNEIEALAESEGMAAVCTTSGTCSPASQSSFSFTIQMDRSVIPFRTALLTHNVLTSADIFFITGTTPFENFKIHLEDVYVEAIQQSGASEKPTYSITLNAKKWRWSYKKTAADAAITYGWNFETNTAF